MKMNIPTFVVHLLSGGLDSTVMLYDLVSQARVHPLLVDYGQVHREELNFAKQHATRFGLKFTLISIPTLRGSTLTDGTGTVVVPNRNAVLLSLAVNLAAAIGASAVTYACNAGDNTDFPDCRPEFVAAYNAMLKAATIDIEVCTPYIDRPKWWIAALGRDIGVDLSKTWSCYREGREPCGVCPACVKRAEALNHHEPTPEPTTNV